MIDVQKFFERMERSNNLKWKKILSITTEDEGARREKYRREVEEYYKKHEEEFEALYSRYYLNGKWKKGCIKIPIICLCDLPKCVRDIPKIEYWDEVCAISKFFETLGFRTHISYLIDNSTNEIESILWLY